MTTHDIDNVGTGAAVTSVAAAASSVTLGEVASIFAILSASFSIFMHLYGLYRQRKEQSK